MGRMFNGSKLSFGGDLTKLVGMSFKVGGADVDVTEPEDDNKLYECGQDDIEVTARFKGGCTLTRGAVGTLAITWNDGSTTPCPGTWQVTQVETSGEWDAAITGSVTFKPTVPAA